MIIGADIYRMWISTEMQSTGGNRLETSTELSNGRKPHTSTVYGSCLELTIRCVLLDVVCSNGTVVL
jgi:hypothetical protein